MVESEAKRAEIITRDDDADRDVTVHVCVNGCCHLRRWPIVQPVWPDWRGDDGNDVIDTTTDKLFDGGGGDGAVAAPSSLTTYDGGDARVEKCGVLVTNDAGRLLVVYTRGQKWGLPKGGRLVGESRKECAERELYEETGVRLTIDDAARWKRIYANFIVFAARVDGDDVERFDIGVVRRLLNNDSNGVGWISPHCLRRTNVPTSTHVARALRCFGMLETSVEQATSDHRLPSKLSTTSNDDNAKCSDDDDDDDEFDLVKTFLEGAVRSIASRGI